MEPGNEALTDGWTLEHKSYQLHDQIMEASNIMARQLCLFEKIKCEFILGLEYNFGCLSCIGHPIIYILRYTPQPTDKLTNDLIVIL